MPAGGGRPVNPRTSHVVLIRAAEQGTVRHRRFRVCLTFSHQREEVVQKMSESFYGTLEVVGR